MLISHQIDLLNSAAKPVKFISIPAMFRIRREVQEFEVAMPRSVVKVPGSYCIQDNYQPPINCRHTRHDRARKRTTYLRSTAISLDPEGILHMARDNSTLWFWDLPFTVSRQAGPSPIGQSKERNKSNCGQSDVQIIEQMGRQECQCRGGGRCGRIVAEARDTYIRRHNPRSPFGIAQRQTAIRPYTRGG